MNTTWKKHIIPLMLVCLTVACRLNMINTPIDITTASSTATHTPSVSPTSLPTATNTPTSTPEPTATLVPTPTTMPGSFAQPLHIGDSVVLDIIPKEHQNLGVPAYGTFQFTLIDVKTDTEAQNLAKQELNWYVYKEPITDQEYLAIYGKIKILSMEDQYTVESIYPSWSLTLRYTESGMDTTPVDSPLWNEGYPPIEGEGWLFYLIRAGSAPYLYFQPNLSVMEAFDIRDTGVYFDLGINR